MGDTNARTGGIGRDCIDNDDKHIPTPSDTYKSRFTKERNSQQHVCLRGKELPELCIQAKDLGQFPIQSAQILTACG